MTQSKEELQLYVLHYADFCFGDDGFDKANSFTEAKMIVLQKPKDSKIAYQYWADHHGIHNKPAKKHEGLWTSEHCRRHKDQGHLFVWAHPTGVERDGRILIQMQGVDLTRGDGPITNDVAELSDAEALAKAHEDTSIAYCYHAPTKRFIEKDPWPYKHSKKEERKSGDKKEDFAKEKERAPKESCTARFQSSSAAW